MPSACGTANCIIIAQIPIENHSEQGQFAELPLKQSEKCKIWAIIVQFAVALPCVALRCLALRVLSVGMLCCAVNAVGWSVRHTYESTAPFKTTSSPSCCRVLRCTAGNLMALCCGGVIAIGGSLASPDTTFKWADLQVRRTNTSPSHFSL